MKRAFVAIRKLKEIFAGENAKNGAEHVLWHSR
jgi:hypothetical protein